MQIPWTISKGPTVFFKSYIICCLEQKLSSMSKASKLSGLAEGWIRRGKKVSFSESSKVFIRPTVGLTQKGFSKSKAFEMYINLFSIVFAALRRTNKQ